MKLPSHMREVHVINPDGTMSIHLAIRKWHPGWWLLVASVLWSMTFSGPRGAK